MKNTYQLYKGPYLCIGTSPDFDKLLDLFNGLPESMKNSDIYTIRDDAGNILMRSKGPRQEQAGHTAIIGYTAQKEARG